MDYLTQPQLADLIRKGYEKHGMKETNNVYYSKRDNSACPMFAAYSYTFESAQHADKNLGYSGLFIAKIASTLNVSLRLSIAINNLHDTNSTAKVSDTLAELDSNTFTY